MLGMCVPTRLSNNIYKAYNCAVCLIGNQGPLAHGHQLNLMFPFCLSLLLQVQSFFYESARPRD